MALHAKPIWAQPAGRGLSIAALLFAVLAFFGTSPALARKHGRRHHHRAHHAHRVAPRLQSPGAGASVQSLPAFTWGTVKGAAQYEFEFSADPHFSSGVNGFGSGGDVVSSTAISGDKAIPDGTYHWRVRGISATDHPGAWSTARTLRKAWTTAPQLNSPRGDTVSWPSSPLVLKWSPVSYAVRYYVWIATDPALSNLVAGSVGSPLQTNGTVLAYPTTLAGGQYYWAITPVDAEGDRGPRSQIASFTWTWPSTTNPTETNIATNAGIVDPQFSWDPIPGAAGYQVEVNSSQQFPPGSKWCCDGETTGTTLSPTNLLPNGTFYWRVRATDAAGDDGVWNDGQPFTESFDLLVPSVPNLQLRDIHNSMAAMLPGSTTDTPIVTWDPVPGASSYEIQITQYQNNFGCDWTQNPITENTATTAWAPGIGGQHIGPSAWPGPEGGPSLAPGAYCFKLLARRDDGSQAGQIISDWTQLGGFNGDAFQFSGAPTGSGPLAQTSSQYMLPLGGSTTSRTPLFTWNPVPGANGYYVVVARDQAFTDVVDVGFADITAYAPEISNRAPYADETTAYWWAVVPSANANGTGVFSDPEFGQDNPQTFNKSSIPPGPLSPVNGTNAGVQPTFRWTSAESARNYHLQVAPDPSFGNPVVDVTTDSAAYTTTATLPADVTLYWRVRADDATGQGLNWSAVSTFTHDLPVPSPSAGNPTGGGSIPLLSWSAVTGATSYDMHVDQSDGSTHDFNLDAPTFTPTVFYGSGIWRWEVRADFPGGNASSAYFSPEAQFTRVLPAPGGVRATKSGLRVLLSWSPDPDATQYQVQLATTDGFASPAANDQTDNTAWAPQIAGTTAAQKLYWRVAAIDAGGNIGAYDSGVFGAPRHGHSHKHHKRHKRHKHR